MAWYCQCSLCLTFSTNSGRTNFARPDTMPSCSVRRYKPFHQMIDAIRERVLELAVEA